MNETKSHVSVDHSFEVQKPGRGKAYLIPVLEWDILKDRVRRTESTGLGFQTAGSVFLGIAGTALVAGLTIAPGITLVGVSTPVICWALFAVSTICGAMSLYFARRQRGLATQTKQDVIFEMEQIERRYGKQSDPQP